MELRLWRAGVYFFNWDTLQGVSTRERLLPVILSGTVVDPAAYARVGFTLIHAWEESELERIFVAHQNLDHPWNVSPREPWHARSMSVGDLVQYGERWWVCKPAGFARLTPEEERQFTAYFLSEEGISHAGQ